MGDYNTVIVSARLKRIDDDKLEDFKKEFSEKLPRVDSAYHATACFLEVAQHSYGTVVSCIAQAKYNRGVQEFMNWFRPMVTQGLGANEAWIINFSEYSKEPSIEYLHEKEEEHGYF